MSSSDRVDGELAAITEREKENIIRNLENNKYPRRQAGFIFRKNFGLREYLMRVTTLTIVFFFAAAPRMSTPRHREDADWLKSFSLVMIIWFTALHALSYVPGALFGSFAEEYFVIGFKSGRRLQTLERFLFQKRHFPFFCSSLLLYNRKGKLFSNSSELHSLIDDHFQVHTNFEAIQHEIQ